MSAMEKAKLILEQNLGKRVIVKADKGRKRIVTRRGILDSVYPSIFVVDMKGSFDTRRKISFTYSDLLTSTVEVTILDDGVEADEALA